MNYITKSLLIMKHNSNNQVNSDFTTTILKQIIFIYPPIFNDTNKIYSIVRYTEVLRVFFYFFRLHSVTFLQF